MPRSDKGKPRPHRKLPKEPRNALRRRRPDLFDGTDERLTLRERLFVLHYEASNNAAQAARDAGYHVGRPEADWARPDIKPGLTIKGNRDAARRVAKALLARPEIQEALRAVQATATRELGDLILTMRIALVTRILDDGPDLVPAVGQLAKMTPGALVPAEVKVDAKMTYADMVLAAQRKREGEVAAVAPAIEQGADESTVCSGAQAPDVAPAE